MQVSGSGHLSDPTLLTYGPATVFPVAGPYFLDEIYVSRTVERLNRQQAGQ